MNQLPDETSPRTAVTRKIETRGPIFFFKENSQTNRNISHSISEMTALIRVFAFAPWRQRLSEHGVGDGV